MRRAPHWNAYRYAHDVLAYAMTNDRPLCELIELAERALSELRDVAGELVEQIEPGALKPPGVLADEASEPAALA